jgi:hypothetical protein
MLARLLRRKNIPPLLVGLQASKNTLEISLVAPQKIGHSMLNTFLKVFINLILPFI